MNRRQFLHTGGMAATAITVGLRTEARPEIEAESTGLKVISQQPQLYHGWPTIARRRNGDLVLVCSGGREGHVCPFGRVELMVSKDEGETWGWPQVVLDSPMDDRDAGVLETSRGALLVTSFTSVAYEPGLKKAQESTGRAGAWPEDRLKAWEAAHKRLSAEQRRAGLGQWMIRSTDGGITWSQRYASIVNSPHGPIELRDGRLLYAGVELWAEARRVGVCESSDDGQTWKWLAAIPVRPGDNPAEYHELHAVEAANGDLIVQIRNHNRENSGETLQTESGDGGKTWSVPHPIGVWGLPSHLLRLRNNTLVMSYGYRRQPFGNQARLSSDNATTWSAPVTISGDGASGDLGYPSTVELSDGSLLTVWYEKLKDSPRAALRQARWRVRR